MVVNLPQYPAFGALLDGTYSPSFAAKLPLWPALAGSFILRSQDPKNRRKIKTMQIWRPSSSDIGGDIVARFAEHQEDLKRRYRELAAGVPDNPVISSPVNGSIVYRLETALELAVTHEERHVLQMGDVRDGMRDASFGSE